MGGRVACGFCLGFIDGPVDYISIWGLSLMGGWLGEGAS